MHDDASKTKFIRLDFLQLILMTIKIQFLISTYNQICTNHQTLFD